MLIVISPAKKLNFENKENSSNSSVPKFLGKSEILIEELRKYKESDISKLMKLSDTLAKLNVERYKKFDTPFTIKNSLQAIYAFKGDTYVGLDADTMNKEQVSYSSGHLRILSGLYGLLSPLDLIQPYRLEMGTKFPCQGNKNLYEFWKRDLTKELNRLLKKEKFLINLASKEYFSAIDLSKLEAEIITPVFKEKKDDNYKVVGIFAKRARGSFSRFIIDNQISKVEDLKTFVKDGYKFSKKMSTSNELVFIRN